MQEKYLPVIMTLVFLLQFFQKQIIFYLLKK